MKATNLPSGGSGRRNGQPGEKSLHFHVQCLPEIPKRIKSKVESIGSRRSTLEQSLEDDDDRKMQKKFL